MIANFLKGLSRVLLIYITLLILIFAWKLVFAGYISGGREYTKSDWFDYYILTSSLIRHAPEASESATYHLQGSDEYQNEEEEVVWINVKDVPGAVQKLNQYLVEKGVDVESEYQRGNEYFVMYYNDVVILRIGRCKYSCP
ncbi:hypothetical protein [Rahnella inusitata]|uniref:hypothetical protein n=1 Tax=Rahnella inusitata TaxID=58169 RepID=UPI0039B01514